MSSPVSSSSNPFKLIMGKLQADMKAAKQVNHDVSKKHIDGKTSIVMKDVKAQAQNQKELKKQEKEFKKLDKKAKEFDGGFQKVAKANQAFEKKFQLESKSSEESSSEEFSGFSVPETKASERKASARSNSEVSLSDYFESRGASFDPDKYRALLQGNQQRPAYTMDEDADSDGYETDQEIEDQRPAYMMVEDSDSEASAEESRGTGRRVRFEDEVDSEQNMQESYRYSKEEAKDYKARGSKKFVEMGEKEETKKTSKKDPKHAKGSVDSKSISFSKAQKALDNHFKKELGESYSPAQAKKGQKKTASKATKGALSTFENLQKDLMKVTDAKTKLVESRDLLKGFYKLEAKEKFGHAIKHFFKFLASLIKSGIAVKKLEKKEKALKKRMTKLEPEAIAQYKKVEASKAEYEVKKIEAKLAKARVDLGDLRNLYEQARITDTMEAFFDANYYEEEINKFEQLIAAYEDFINEVRPQEDVMEQESVRV